MKSIPPPRIENVISPSARPEAVTSADGRGRLPASFAVKAPSQLPSAAFFMSPVTVIASGPA